MNNIYIIKYIHICIISTYLYFNYLFFILIGNIGNFWSSFLF